MTCPPEPGRVHEEAAREASEDRFLYGVSGWVVASDRALPYLAPARNAARAPDIEITFGALAPLATAATQVGPFHVHAAGTVEMRPSEELAIRIRDGRSIRVALDAPMPDAELHTLLFGPVMAVLAQQRGQPALHAAAVIRGDRALAICGHQGAGKSTTVQALLRRGYRLMSDDQLAIDPGSALAHPSYPYGKLWSSSGPVLGTSVSGAAVARGVDKFHVSAEAVFYDKPHRLGAIAVLAPTSDLEQADARRMPSAEAVAIIHRMIHYGQLGRTMGVSARNFAWATRIAAAVPLYIVRRTTDPAQLDHLLEVLEDCLADAASTG